MCLVAFAYRVDPRFDLVLIANRDEFFNRPAEPAHFWPAQSRPAQLSKDSSGILAGQDIQAGGTWMGVARDGRFALLTNYRDPSRIRTNVKSRGLLVSDFLSSNVSAREYLESVEARAGDYNDFNLLAGSPEGIFYFSSMDSVANGSENASTVQEIKPGIYGMSNHLFETPWPKVVRARNRLKKALESKFQSQPAPSSSAELTQSPRSSDDQTLRERLFQILADPTPAPDEELPETGVGLEKERGLSSIFITLPGYGTRCSTLLLIKPNGKVEYSERTYASDRTEPPKTVDFMFHRSKNQI